MWPRTGAIAMRAVAVRADARLAEEVAQRVVGIRFIVGRWRDRCGGGRQGRRGGARGSSTMPRLALLVLALGPTLGGYAVFKFALRYIPGGWPAGASLSH